MGDRALGQVELAAIPAFVSAAGDLRQHLALAAGEPGGVGERRAAGRAAPVRPAPRAPVRGRAPATSTPSRWSVATPAAPRGGRPVALRARPRRAHRAASQAGPPPRQSPASSSRTGARKGLSRATLGSPPQRYAHRHRSPAERAASSDPRVGEAGLGRIRSAAATSPEEPGGLGERRVTHRAVTGRRRPDRALSVRLARSGMARPAGAGLREPPRSRPRAGGRHGAVELAVAPPTAGLLERAAVEQAACHRRAHVVAGEGDLVGVEVRERPRGERIDDGVVAVEGGDPATVPTSARITCTCIPPERATSRASASSREPWSWPSWPWARPRLAIEASTRDVGEPRPAGRRARAARAPMSRAPRGSSPTDRSRASPASAPGPGGVVVNAAKHRDRLRERPLGVGPAALARSGEAEQVQRPRLQHVVAQAAGDRGGLLVRAGRGAGRVVGRGPAGAAVVQQELGPLGRRRRRRRSAGRARTGACASGLGADTARPRRRRGGACRTGGGPARPARAAWWARRAASPSTGERSS